MMEIVVDNKIKITDPASDLLGWCKANLELDNPDFAKKQAMGKWTGNTPRRIVLYERSGNVLTVPFGCLQKLWAMIGAQGAIWKSVICDLRAVLYQSGINLYSYQETAVNEALKRKNGILVMPCGSGKTQSGLEVIARIGGRALWLTHTQELLTQSKERAENVLDVPDGAFGTITAGKIHIGTHITFATIQTMAKIDLNDYKDYWDIIIVDECQHCCGSPTKVTQFYRVVSRLSARYKIGLTATPKRSDGLERSMFALLGGVIHEVDKSAVKSTTCPVKVRQIETEWVPDYNCIITADGTLDYSKIIDDLVKDDDRLMFIFDEILHLGPSVIVLANRVAYLQKLCAAYNDMGHKALCLSGMGNSKAAKEERKEALRRLNAGELDCIFATYQLAKEGLDVPNLRYVVFATPEKDETTVTQAAGRVGRKAEGKEFGTVIDFVDVGLPKFENWARKRKAIYKRLNYGIM